MKRILVNATQQEELRVAIVDGQKLYNLDIEATAKRQKKGNIYKGVISSIAPSLNAVFIDYGGARQGFLPTKEICPRYFNAKFKGPLRDQIVHELIEEGQELIVQIVREERANKGASLSSYITLTGEYLVLLPHKSRTQGISQRIPAKDRQRMIDMSRQLSTNEKEGLILRTACLNAKKEDLQKNLNYLRYLWKQIQKVADERPAPFLIYKETNIVLQAIQNNLGSDISEIIIDNQEIYEETKEFLSMALPRYKRKLKLYDGNTPLFNRMQIEAQIETLYQHKIDLPSGGSIVLDHTEALTTIDINSARSTQQQDLEETALATNLEAIDEIARQLRLRDLGGLLVIDFIDMLSNQNKRKVEEHMHAHLRKDRARTRLGNISKFGLLEMSRQRLRPSLQDESEILCPRCNGRGSIRTVKSCALVVLRLIEEEAAKAKTAQVVGHVPDEVNKFLINEKRTELDEIEQRYGVKVSIISDSQMETPHYKIMRHRKDNGGGYNKNYQDSVVVRSSQYQPQIVGRQNETTEAIEDEVPALPPVLAKEKTTLSETFKNLWQKLLGVFSRKETKNKQHYKTYQKRRNYYSRQSKSPYTKRKQYRSTQTRKPYNKNSGYKKPAQTQSGFRPRRDSAKPQNYRQDTKFSPTKSSMHSNRKRRMYRKPDTYSDDARYQAPTSQPHDDTINQASEQTLAAESQSSYKNNQPSDTPQTMAKPPTNADTSFKKFQFNKGESKFVQIETKTKNDDNPK